MKLTIYNITTRSRIMGIMFLLYALAGCEEFVAIDPPTTEITEATVFTSDATTLSAVVGVYSKMMESDDFFTSGRNSITTLAGLSSGELINYDNNSTKVLYANNQLNTTATLSLWSDMYKIIYYSNSAIEGLQKANKISVNLKNQLLGEMFFVRAYCHFYLVNLFGAIPIVTTTDYRTNNQLNRSAVSEVYDQIVKDLKQAQDQLTTDYSFSDGERTRPNKWVATAMLARVYLYMEDWANAEIQSTAVIANSNFTLENDLNNIFLANSKEAIWQLKPVQPGYNTFDGSAFILTSEPNVVALSDRVVNDFELSDRRKSVWVGSLKAGGNNYYYAYKYKIRVGFDVQEYLMMLRLAEQYLIRSEARAHLNKLPEALEDINSIRNRAGIAPVLARSQQQVLNEIENQRRMELFSEWGHRWLDLKRTKRIDEVIGPLNPTWETTDALYPIPESEIRNNPNLGPQNPGY